MVTFTITGAEELIRAALAYGEGVLPVAAAGLYEEAEAIIGDSRENYVPVDLAVLKGSGHAALPEIDGDTVTQQLGYGGAAESYAIEQHERMDYRHTVGGAKYLWLPLMSAMSGMAGRLAAFIRERTT